MANPKKRPKRFGAEGSGVWPRMVKEVVRRDSGKCHLCQHFGAKSADHVIPVTEAPEKAMDMGNLRAAHSYPGGCDECSKAAARTGGSRVYCNEIRGMGSIERARRLIEERTGLKLGITQTQAPESEGRDIWLQRLGQKRGNSLVAKFPEIGASARCDESAVLELVR